MSNSVIEAIIKVVIYIRVSTKEQAEEGGSLATQERLCREFAARNGYEVVMVFIEEGESAKTANRTKLKEMMEYCTKHRKDIDALLIYKIDRLSRNTVDYAQLKMFFTQLEVKVVSITESLDDSPVGRFVETTLASVSQLDNDIRAERSKNGMIDAVRDGRWVWQAPTGYENIKVEGKKNIAPIKDSKQPGYIHKAFELIDNGLHPEQARRIATKEGLRSNRGNKISKSGFYKILENKLYKGVIEAFGMTIVSTSIVPIVEPDLYDRVLLKYKGEDKPPRRYQKANPLFPLRGTVRCIRGHFMTASPNRGNGGVYYKYHCAHCRGKGTSHPKQKIETRFREHINGFEYQDVLKDALMEAISVNWEYRTASSHKEVRKLEGKKTELKAREKQIIDKNLKGVYDDKRTQELIAENDLALVRLQIDINDLAGQDEDVTEIAEFGFSSLQRIGTIWEEELQDVEIKQRFQKWLFPVGIPFDGENFGTTDIPLCLSIKKDFSEEKSLLVIPRRIELRFPD